MDINLGIQWMFFTECSQVLKVMQAGLDRCGSPSNAYGVGAGFLERGGDEATCRILHDAILDDGMDQGDFCMQSVKVDDTVFIKTVHDFYTGRVTAVNLVELVLDDAAWVAHTGRFHRAFITGEFQEVEPYPDGNRLRVPISSIVSLSDWPFPLPREVVPPVPEQAAQPRRHQAARR